VSTLHHQHHHGDAPLPPAMIDPNYRLVEDQVEMRLHSKHLAQCELPEGFRLVTPTPKQAWVDQQLMWVFVLGWAPVDIQGRRWCEDRYQSVFRYHQVIPDEIQMQWAVGQFTRELVEAEVFAKAKPQYHHPRMKVAEA
jgi:hypothetical protein